MVYKTLLFGHSILARPSWAYVYMKCMDDFQMMRRITDALGDRTVAWMRDIEECVRGHAPDGNAIRSLRLSRRAQAELKKTFDSALKSSGKNEDLNRLLAECGLDWPVWQKS